MKGVDADFAHLLRRGNALFLHRLQYLGNGLAVFVPQSGKLGVVHHTLPSHDFHLLGLAYRHKFRLTCSERYQRHEALHAVNLVLLAAKKLHLLLGQREAVMYLLLSHVLCLLKVMTMKLGKGIPKG